MRCVILSRVTLMYVLRPCVTRYISPVTTRPLPQPDVEFDDAGDSRTVTKAFGPRLRVVITGRGQGLTLNPFPA